MNTVKEIAELTGVSTRTLRYYDEIGLLSPTCKSEAGYRLYDDKALERLQQILFFREFEIPLKEIKSILGTVVSEELDGSLDSHGFDRNQILRMQRRMLVAKKERLERLIASIDDILNGVSEIDFSVFNRTEVDEMFKIMLERMPENIRSMAIREFGSVAEWKKHYIKMIASKEMQEQYVEIFRLYGGKDNYLSQMKQSVSKEEAEEFKAWEDGMIRKILGIKKENNWEDLRKVVREYGKGCKEFYHMQEEKEMLLSLAKSMQNELVCGKFDERYGNGAAEEIRKIIETEYL